MITAYVPEGDALVAYKDPDDRALATAVWIDLLSPTGEEEDRVESPLGINIPTRDEMREVESSSQLYHEDGAAFITLRALSRAAGQQHRLAAITLVMVKEKLVTVRYADPTSFRNFITRAIKTGSHGCSALSTLVCFAEALVDRNADILEEVGDHLDKVSSDIFSQSATSMDTIAAADLAGILKVIGRNGDLTARIRESLHSVSRAIPFLRNEQMDETIALRMKTLAVDTQSLLDHAMFLTTEVQFLLDSSLGLISIQQNAIMKSLSIAAVFFLPATVIGSIYGMNFVHMPELQWRYGYLWALGLMGTTALGSYLYLRARKWF